MKFTDIFIRRPVLALVVNLVIIIAGLQAIRSLNVRQYPRSDNAAVTVTTVYVGASAELVRGFITTPLERAIAAADGIDYIESQSAQGFSTITVRLKLNYDPIKALAEISSKVDQVRNDLPPEAEVPIINVESADSQFASAYLSFRSDVLEQNQITDYLVRVVQPRLSALEGVQRADILGGRTFAMRIWLKPDRMAALNISPAQVRQALAANNYLAAVGQHQGLAHPGQPDRQHRPALRGGVQAASSSASRAAPSCGWRTSPTWCWARRTTTPRCGFAGQTAVFMGIWPLPNANSLDVIKRVRAEMDAIQKELPSGMHGAHCLRRHRVHQGRHPRGGQDADRNAAHRGDRHLPVPRLAALGAHPGGGHSAVADRRGVSDAGVRFHHQPAHAAGHRAVRRPGGRRCHRGGGKRRAPSERRQDAARGGAARRARTGRARSSP